MKNIFVTGATGFVGKNLVPKLATQGYNVTCLARNPDHQLFKDFASVKWVKGDILDPIDLLAPLIEGHDTVYHLAGLIGYKKSIRERMFKVNVNGTEAVLHAAIEVSCENFIFMSSVAAIGAGFTPDTIMNEDSPYNLDGYDFGYFDSKHLAEKRVVEISSHSALKTFILNPSTIYGPGDSSKSSRATQVKVAKGGFPFAPPGGVNVVHIDDVIQACLSVVTLGQKNRRYILAGENILIRDLFFLIAKFANVPPPKWVLPKYILYSLGFIGDLTQRFALNSGFSLENARVACCYHWFSNARAISELKIQFKSSEAAIKDSVNSLLAQV